MQKLNFILEQINGAASLLTFSLLLFLSFYLWDWLAYKHRTPWSAMLVGLPPAIALAAILYMEKIGTLMTRVVVWSWRTFREGNIPFNDVETGFLIGGAAITSMGLLLMIRLLTLPRFGNRAWVASAAITAAYLLATTIWHFVA